MNRRTLLVGMGALALFRAAAVQAADATILTVRGGFAKAGPDGSAELSLADLDALRQTQFTTSTPWQSNPATFSGVTVEDLFEAIGVSGKDPKLQLIALNDYVAESATSELTGGGALLATRIDGEPMTVRDKGPIFIVFPFDSRSELQHQTYYSRSVWQLAEIDIVP